MRLDMSKLYLSLTVTLRQNTLFLILQLFDIFTGLIFGGRGDKHTRECVLDQYNMRNKTILIYIY